MNQIFLATHGHMASGVKSSLDLLIGTTQHITTFDAYVDNRNLEEELNQFFLTCTEEDVALLITDLYGGSVHNQLTAYITKHNTFLISGFNLAFLLELCVNPQINITLEKLLALIEESKMMFRYVSTTDFQTEIADEDIFNEEVTS